MIRVLIVDDHPATRAGVRQLLETHHVEVLGEAASAAEGLALTERLRPDVVVLDMDMPDRSGSEIAGDLRALGTRVLVYSAHAGRGFVGEMLKAGVEGYITKDQPEDRFVEALRAVAVGEGRWFVRPTVPEGPLASLTDRERDVLRLLAKGLSNEHIGETLSITAKTVRNLLSAVYQKIDVSNSREAIIWARHLGFGQGGTG